jgi:hypothetical protein
MKRLVGTLAVTATLAVVGVACRTTHPTAQSARSEADEGAIDIRRVRIENPEEGSGS